MERRWSASPNNAFLTPVVVGEDRDDADFYVNKFKSCLPLTASKVPGNEDSTRSAVIADSIGYMMRNAMHTLDNVFSRLLCFGCIAHVVDLPCKDSAKLLERVMVDAGMFIAVFLTSHERLRQMFSHWHRHAHPPRHALFLCYFDVA